MKRRATTTDYRGQRVLLVGLGLHGGGVATVRWLVQQGAIVRVTDIQTAKQLAASLAKLRGIRAVFHLGGYQAADWAWAERMVVNPGVQIDKHPQISAAMRRGVMVENEASIFVRKFPGKIIGLTGTRGKTTTTLLLGAILKQAHRDTIVSGNVRQVPMLEYLPRTSASTWAVLELSSYQLERLPVVGHPIHMSVMTNLKNDHIDRHGSLSAYTQIKYNIFRGQTQSDKKVLNWDDPACRRAKKIGHGQTTWFGLMLPKNTNGVTLKNSWVVEQSAEKIIKLFPLRLWKLPGEHNQENILAAVAAARAMGVNTKTIQHAVKLFQGVPFRQQYILTYRGHELINDTAATSPDATLAAISVYPRGVYIVGGTDKQLDFKSLAREIVRRNIPIVFLPGSATVTLQTSLRTLKYRQPIITVQSMPSALSTALAVAERQQEIILSPGAASFGIFRHEFDRGEQFNRAIKKLP